MSRRRQVVAVYGTAVAVVVAVFGAGAAEQTASDQAVPSDLRPLLSAPQSELRLVVQRYGLDRATLNGNFDGRGTAGGRGNRGAGPAAATPPPAGPSLSRARIARLARYDLDWQTALGRLKTSTLSPSGKTDLQSLQASIESNRKQLEADTLTIAQLAPVMPFAQAIIDLSEARIRLQPVDAAKAAGILTQLTKQIADVRSRIESGFTRSSGPGGLIVNAEVAKRAAEAVDTLKTSLTAWFNFYNGYDPVFTWWMGVPFTQVDGALQDYAAFLRDKVVGADWQVEAVSTAPPIEPAPAPAIDEVPDLAEIIALPQDEMTAIVQRFVGDAGGRGGRGSTNAPAAGRPRQYYLEWLEALKAIDFDRLSRNAQVDYLFIKNACERHIARIDFTPQPDPPRKTDDTGIPGPARGRDGLILDLGDEMIPYSPEQLIALANKEFEWCEQEMKRASRQMGFGDDWKKAVEKVKEMHVPPGGQPQMIRGLLFEAVDYLRKKDLVTVPEIASESLHMSMMTPEQQLSSPFFLGGNQILVSYPTNTMEYDARIQSMRGNNIPFSHATAFHEMIPGHNLVGFMGTRFGGYRARLGGSTPFFGEGWPLYWELTLYDLGFDDTPEKRVGALFWRMHRCARIIFSLNFHMGEWSPKQCIDFLVEKVGHERDNATAEVRRSFQGGYSPLYQAAYLLGGLQLRGLRKELVDSKKMTNRQFHDEILRQGSMPIALLRLAITRLPLSRDMTIDWKFYGELPGN